MFHNSELTDSQWTKIGDILEKIMLLCMGQNLYDILFKLQNGETMYIDIAEDYSGKFGHKVVNGKHVISITLGKQLDGTQFLHEMMHAHRYLTVNDTAKYNASRLNGEIEAKFTQLIYADKIEHPIIEGRQTKLYEEYINELKNIIDHKGNLKDPTKVDLLKTQITNIIVAYSLDSVYEHYKYDFSYNSSSHFENLRTITSNCP